MIHARRVTCARCRRPRRQVAKVMPDGPLCAHCYFEALRRRGRCGGCAQVRLLPGVDASGEALCCGCAGIDENYTCKRCGTEWALCRGLCEWCHLGDVLDGLLDGDVDLSGLRARLLSVARPASIIIWLYNPHARELLAALANGTVPLTHPALDDFNSRRTADHLRLLLIAVGLLPERDERLARYDRWVAECLAEHATTGEDLKVLQQFATWGLRRRLVTASHRGPLRDGQINSATQNLRVAAGLLTWLHERHRELRNCRQADLDEWFITPPRTRCHAEAFVRWALNNGRLPKLRLPARPPGAAPIYDQTQRLDTLRRLLDPGSGRLEHRVAAVLLVLLGQPFTKIAALRVDDIAINADNVAIRLGQGDTPIPPPFAAMIAALVAHRHNLNTATNPNSGWLFPGQNADGHVAPGTLSTAAINMGINLISARTGALRQLVLDCPPTVVADALGYSYQAIDRHAQRAGSPWSSYAALKPKAKSTSRAMLFQTPRLVQGSDPVSGDDIHRLELVGELGSWQVTLTTGEVLDVAAHAYSRDDDNFVFSALMEGRPPYEIALLRVPTSAVARIRGGPRDRPQDSLRTRMVGLANGRTIPFGELADGWAKRVARIRDELESDPTDPNTWGIHDYIGALHNRDQLDQAMTDFDGDELAVAKQMIRPSDDLLRSFTIPDPNGRLLRISQEDRVDAWWWLVIPTSGPVLAEIVQTETRREKP